jgi:predicted lipid-binding transport protein (Tim44 family)
MLNISEKNQNRIEIGNPRVVGASDQHHDRYVHYTHQMPDETAEASARVLIRLVPLMYGALMGGLYGHLAAGLLLGLVPSLALDYRMGGKSLIQPVLQRCAATGCPLLAAAVRGMSAAIGAIGLPVPTKLRQKRCEAL